ncbi:MAG: hypothetical protein M3N38_08790, partial [Pseudomonadota bacterium]|nr:hypothetical protein [Pseudomonadota bacterium]
MNEVEPTAAIAGSAPGAAQASCARWLKEIARAEKHREEWLRRSESVLDRYRRQKSLSADAGIRRFAMLWANTEVLKPSIYARPPAPQVSRRYRDRDPVGRLAAEILERSTAFELERMNLDQVLRNCRDDLLLPGRGTAWVRYEADIGPRESGEPAPAEAEPAPAEAGVKAERVQVDYVHWKCFLHGPARTWEEVTWVARQGYFARDELERRFRIAERGLEVSLDHSAKSEGSAGD